MTATAAPPAAPPFDRRQRLLLAVVLGVAVLLGWLARQPPVTTGGDDSTYLLLAEALRQGRYVDLFLPGTPPHAQYPPGLPLVIALAQLVAGQHVVAAMQVVNLLLHGATALLVAVAVRRRFSPDLGVAVGAVVALNPLLLHYTGWVLSETLFVASTTAALAVVAMPCRALRIRHWLLAVTLALVAFFTRSAGITAVFAVIGGLIACRRWRLALAGASSLGLLAAWFAYTKWAAGQTVGWSYANDLAYVKPNVMLDLLVRLGHSIRVYFRVTPRRGLGIPDIADMPLDNLLWLALLAIPFALGVRALWRPWRVAVIFLALYCLVLLVYPFALLRLVVPIVPLIIAALVIGARDLGTRLGFRRPDVAAFGAALLLGAAGTTQGAIAAAEQVRCRATPPGACRSPAEQSWQETAAWMRGHLPSDAVVASSKPSTVYRVSGRRGIPSRVIFLGSVDEILAPSGPVTHIFLSRLWSYEWEDLPATLRGACSRLRLLPAPSPAALVLEILPPGAPPRSDGCTAMVRFRQAAIESGLQSD